jgi:hypothetical protein
VHTSSLSGEQHEEGLGQLDVRVVVKLNSRGLSGLPAAKIISLTHLVQTMHTTLLVDTTQEAPPARFRPEDNNELGKYVQTFSRQAIEQRFNRLNWRKSLHEYHAFGWLAAPLATDAQDAQRFMWFIESDVLYSGRWRTLFQALKPLESEYDFVVRVQSQHALYFPLALLF